MRNPDRKAPTRFAPAADSIRAMMLSPLVLCTVVLDMGLAWKKRSRLAVPHLRLLIKLRGPWCLQRHSGTFRFRVFVVAVAANERCTCSECECQQKHDQAPKHLSLLQLAGTGCEKSYPAHVRECSFAAKTCQDPSRWVRSDVVSSLQLLPAQNFRALLELFANRHPLRSHSPRHRRITWADTSPRAVGVKRFALFCPSSRIAYSGSAFYARRGKRVSASANQSTLQG